MALRYQKVDKGLSGGQALISHATYGVMSRNRKNHTSGQLYLKNVNPNVIKVVKTFSKRIAIKVEEGRVQGETGSMTETTHRD